MHSIFSQLCSFFVSNYHYKTLSPEVSRSPQITDHKNYNKTAIKKKADQDKYVRLCIIGASITSARQQLSTYTSFLIFFLSHPNWEHAFLLFA